MSLYVYISKHNFFVIPQVSSILLVLLVFSFCLFVFVLCCCFKIGFLTKHRTHWLWKADWLLNLKYPSTSVSIALGFCTPSTNFIPGFRDAKLDIYFKQALSYQAISSALHLKKHIIYLLSNAVSNELSKRNNRISEYSRLKSSMKCPS